MWNLDGLPPDTIQLIERNTHESAQAYPDMRGPAVKSHCNGYLQVIEPSHRKFNTTTSSGSLLALHVVQALHPQKLRIQHLILIVPLVDTELRTRLSVSLAATTTSKLVHIM